MASPVLFLAYGNRRLEVLSGAGFDSVCHQAEAALSLHPQSYEIYDACGKIDADNFDRSLASSRGLCVLELREKPEWQKMRQMEQQIQQLLDRSNEGVNEEVEKQVALQVEMAMQKMKAQLRKDLDLDKTALLQDSSSIVSRVASLETELAEQQIDVSADLGRLEAALCTAQAELEDLRHFAAEQLGFVEKNQGEMKKDVEEMESIKTKVAKSVDELSEKMAAIEIDLSEQSITTSAVNGLLESGVATAKQELDLLRQSMVEQFTFLNSKMELLERPKGISFPQTIAWSDGFKTHELETGTPSSATGQLFGKTGSHVWQSAPTLRRAAKSLPQLPPLM